MKFNIVDRLIKDLRVSAAGVKEGIEQVAEKTDLKMRVAKISLEVSRIEEELEKAYRTLGELAYREAIPRPADFYQREDVAAAMRSIQEEASRIHELERQIERIQEGRVEENLMETAGHLKEADWTVETFRVGLASRANGSRLSDAGKPREILVVAVIRGEGYRLPQRETVLQEGDLVTVIAQKNDRKTVEAWLCGD